MAILGTFTKQPGERLDFDVDFSEWLSTTDTIASVVSVCDTGLVVETPLKDVTNKIVKQWITGGTTGTTYKVQITATTTEGRIKEAEFKVKVKEV